MCLPSDLLDKVMQRRLLGTAARAISPAPLGVLVTCLSMYNGDVQLFFSTGVAATVR